MICPHCSYEWEPRIEKPKSCPMCKQYLEKPGRKRPEKTMTVTQIVPPNIGVYGLPCAPIKPGESIWQDPENMKPKGKKVKR